MWQSLILIGREEGRRGLYAGMGTHVARVVSDDKTEGLLEKKQDRKNGGSGGGSGAACERLANIYRACRVTAVPHS